MLYSSADKQVKKYLFLTNMRRINYFITHSYSAFDINPLVNQTNDARICLLNNTDNFYIEDFNSETCSGLEPETNTSQLTI